ncbi:hypothetical protein BASA81_000777 [Batrachochytrium salamandrivorans]|nr:hypothetical protein BASA81_000777 [Batrachochytrium salamandrivorans]
MTTTRDSDAVYRGLAGVMSAPSPATASPQSAQSKTLPRHPFADLPTNRSMFLMHCDETALPLFALERSLREVCSQAFLERSDAVYVFYCQAQASDGDERVEFSLNVWGGDSSGEYLLEVTRLDGCPFLLQQILTKVAQLPSGGASSLPHGLFRVPKLPECLRDSFLCDNGTSGGGVQCLQKMLDVCVGVDFEQRKQTLKALADLTRDNPRLTRMFHEANGPELLSPLLQDHDPCIQRLVERTLENTRV